MEMETCKCKCHPVREVCRVCCVRTAKDESFDLMMKQNQTVLDLQEKLKQSDLQIDELKGQLELILSEKFRALDEWEKSRRLNGEYRKALQRIASIESCHTLGSAMKVAEEALVEKRNSETEGA